MKKSVVIGIVVLIAVLLSAVLYFFINNLSKPKLTPENSFYFSYDEKWDESAVAVGITDINAYICRFPDAQSTYYKSKLEGSDLSAYNCISYAADKGYSYVFIPSAIYDTLTLPVENIITMYACDSPFLEHNFFVEGMGFAVQKIDFANTDDDLYSFSLPHNNSGAILKREVAYKEAKKIVGAMPTDLMTNASKAGYLYDYLVKNVSFADKDKYDMTCVPIYEALCSTPAKAICDGYADALTLLFNTAGIDTFSTVGQRVGTKEGHTMNIAKVDGMYYYFDASSDYSTYEKGYKPRFFFMLDEASLKDFFSPSEIVSGYLPVAAVNGQLACAEVVVTDAPSAAEEAVKIIRKDGSVLVNFFVSSDELIYTFEDELKKRLLTGLKIMRTDNLSGYMTN